MGSYLRNLFQPADEYQLTSQLFLKLLALVYFSAFLSLYGQILGLVGSNGILPFSELLVKVSQQFGLVALLRVPNLFWLSSADWAIQGATVLGCLLSMALFFNIFPRASLIGLFVLYLSLTKAGQIFLNFQWDYLLLESGFLAIFLVSRPNRLIIFLFHWLLFRLRFMSGISKLASGDPSWSGLTALQTYFEAQPLPHAGAWFAHQVPEWILKAGVLFTFFTELIVPFFIFLPRRFRLFAAFITLSMQLLIIATSNHNFINLLTILLCLFLLDDRLVSRILPEKIKSRLLPDEGETHQGYSVTISIVAIIILSASLPLIIGMLSGSQLPKAVHEWTRVVRTAGIGNAYHVFPTMQTERIELQIEGSNDGLNWQAYALPYQPNRLDERPEFIIPHQPRLDWMIWFVPSQQPETSLWFGRFIQKIKTGSPEVLGLLE